MPFYDIYTMAKIQYEISVIGIDKVKQMTKSVEKELAQHERKLRSKVRATNRAMGGSPSRGFNEIGKVAARQQVKEFRAAERLQNKQYKDQLRAAERANAYRVKLAVQAAKQVERAEIRAFKRVERERARVERQSSKLAAGMNRRGGMGGPAGLSGMGALAGLGKIAIPAALVAAVGLAVNKAIGKVTDAYKESHGREIDERMVANRVAGDMGISRGDALLKVRGYQEKYSRSHGIGSDDVLGAFSEWSKVTGDAARFEGIFDQYADVMVARAIDPKQLAKMAGQQWNSNAGKSDAERMSAVNDSLKVMIASGELGSIEIEDMPKLAAAMGSYSNKVTGDKNTNDNRFLTLAQLLGGMGGLGADEITTALKALTTDMTKNEKKFSSLGVDVWADKGKTKLKDPVSVIKDILNKTGGDLSKLTGLFGQEARKVFDILSNPEGMKAFDEFLKDMAYAFDPKKIADDAKFLLDSNQAKMEKAKQEFERVVYDSFLPAVSEAIPMIEEAIPKIAKWLVFAGEMFAEILQSGTFRSLMSALGIDMNEVERKAENKTKLSKAEAAEKEAKEIQEEQDIIRLNDPTSPEGKKKIDALEEKKKELLGTSDKLKGEVAQSDKKREDVVKSGHERLGRTRTLLAGGTLGMSEVILGATPIGYLFQKTLGNIAKMYENNGDTENPVYKMLQGFGIDALNKDAVPGDVDATTNMFTFFSDLIEKFGKDKDGGGESETADYTKQAAIALLEASTTLASTVRVNGPFGGSK